VNPFVTIERVISTLSIAFAVALTKVTEDVITSQASQIPGAVVFVVLVPALSLLLKSLSTKIFNKSRILRKLVWGKHDIEGCWIDCVSAEGTIISLGINQISVRDFVVHWRGQNFKPDGSPTSAYEAIAVSIDWPINKFWYATHPFFERSKQDEGIAELTFTAPDGKPPRLYHGWACDTAGNQMFALQGKRISEVSSLSALSEVETQTAELLAQADVFFAATHKETEPANKAVDTNRKPVASPTPSAAADVVVSNPPSSPASDGSP